MEKRGQVFYLKSFLKSRRHEVMETKKLQRRAAGTVFDIHGSSQPLPISAQISAENKH